MKLDLHPKRSRITLALLAAVAAASCHPSRPSSESTGGGLDTSRRYSVVAYGYNYTDTYIDSFEVNGDGGGNLAVSTPTSPGGGHTCCTTLSSGLPLGTEFTIKWTRDRKRWCEQTVPLTKPIPIEPRYLEVHFYQDGHIEIEATQQASLPRLKLESFNRGQRHKDGNTNNDEKLSRCKDAY